MIKKVIYAKKDMSKVFVRDTEKDVHLKFGMIKKEDLQKKQAVSNINQGFYILDADSRDSFERIRREKQTVIPKDSAAVLAYTMPDSNSVVAEAGTGAGGFACFIARYVKKVYSFDIDDNAIAMGRENAETLGIKNIEFARADFSQGIPVQNVDLLFLDLPDPVKILQHACKALKRGGYLVVYNPQITQHKEVIDEIAEKYNNEFIHIRTVELIERYWDVGGRKARPNNRSIGHTAFLSVFRYVG